MYSDERIKDFANENGLSLSYCSHWQAMDMLARRAVISNIQIIFILNRLNFLSLSNKSPK